jgi:hypothetical protein
MLMNLLFRAKWFGEFMMTHAARRQSKAMAGSMPHL